VIFYPAKVEGCYKDVKWALDKEGLVNGLNKLFHGYLPKVLFKPLTDVCMGVYKDAPLHPRDKKYPVVLFSHGVGQTPNFFSTILKDLARQGYVVFSLEHRDFSALHFRASSLKLFRDVEMRDFESNDLRLSMRK